MKLALALCIKKLKRNFPAPPKEKSLKLMEMTDTVYQKDKTEFHGGIPVISKGSVNL